MGPLKMKPIVVPNDPTIPEIELPEQSGEKRSHNAIVAPANARRPSIRA